MEEGIIISNLIEESYTSTFKNFMDLIDIRVAKLRLKNDTAAVDEVFKNQGAIRELLALKNVFIKARKNTTTYDGSFS